jgi:hypothetical protein
VELWGATQVTKRPISLPCPFSQLNGRQNALTQKPEVADIVTPPHPMPARLEGAG